MRNCNQYLCVNNTGWIRGKLVDSSNNGKCKLDSPRVTEFGQGIWGCADERYKKDTTTDK